MYPLCFFLHFPHLTDASGSISTDVRNEYVSVMAVMTPNCTCGGIGEKINMMNPAVVVIAAISSALPVWLIVSETALYGSPVLSAVSLNLSVVCIA